MSRYSVVEKLEALEIACRINNISDDYKLELTNNIIRCMGFTIGKQEKNGKIKEKFIDGRLANFIPFKQLVSILGFQLGEEAFIELSKKAAISCKSTIIEEDGKLYIKDEKGCRTCYNDGYGYDIDIACNLYKKFNIKSEPLHFCDICPSNK